LKPLSAALLAFALLSGTVVAPRSARADQATEAARGHYETGLELFYAREHAQALIEFQRAHEIKPRPATLFMMAQCEYLLGSLRQAREHYEAYLSESPTGEFVEVAKDRIESINRRPATLVINTVPDQVDVRIVAADAAAPTSTTPAVVMSGQAPNNFSVPRGRWLVSVSKPNFLPQELVVQVSVAETKPLFFKLEPIPARLEIETSPVGATLYVNGNRARNPYFQDVAPGRIELFAEAPDYGSRTEEITLAPGDKRLFLGPNVFRLRYVQRSGRPELVTASAIVGALVGAGAVAAGLGTDLEGANVSSVTFALGGAVTGAVAGVLVANNIVPARIPDNRGLFVIGGMWIGATEGALAGFVLRQARATENLNDAYREVGPYKHVPLGSQLRWGFVGSLPGILVGTGAGALMVDKAPTYGRVALIQSAAAGGAVAGSLAAVALRWNPFELREVTRKYDSGKMEWGPPYLQDARSTLTLSLPALIGLNVGLGAGLLAAYLPDQSRYGPSWKRVALVDLTAGAGALAGGIFACVADPDCVKGNEATPLARAHAAEVALLTGGLGAIAGILLSRNVDKGYDSGTPASATPPPTLGLLPASDGHGGMTPLLTAAGLF
jgi:hypothetical protein